MRILELVPLHLRPLLQSGDSVVDATAGNGYDSLWLAEAVGPSGCVHAFDVQKSALVATRQRLADAGYEKVLQTHHCSHAEMALHVPAGQRVILFNLGYLPGSQRDVTTKADSTLPALCAALALLARHGRLCVMTYSGHDSGRAEFHAVSDFFESLPLAHFTVTRTTCHNGSKRAPILFSVEKHRDMPYPEHSAKS
ncbi:MAG: class I SAM-dependent methyltransferase [Akkermansia sp.]